MVHYQHTSKINRVRGPTLVQKIENQMIESQVMEIRGRIRSFLILPRRSRAGSNRCTSFCRALPNHSATGPLLFLSYIAKCTTRAKIGYF